MEPWILRVSCKVSEARMIRLTFQKLNLLLIFTFYYNYLVIYIISNLGIKAVLYLKSNHINGLVGE